MPDIFDASKLSKPASQEETSPESQMPASEGTQPVQNEPPMTSDDSAPNHGTTDVAAERPNVRRGKHVDEYSSVMRAEQSCDNPLYSFVPKPTKIAFDSQQADEQVLLLLRRHPITQLRWILIVIVMAFLPFLFESIGLLSFFPARFHFAAGVGWYLLLLGFSLESFLTWFYNVYLVTDERVVDVDFYNLLYKNISSAKIDNIEDISSEAGGLLSSIFNFGTVRIQTAGTAPEFEFDDVPQPAKVTAFLNEMLLEEEREELEGRVN